MSEPKPEMTTHQAGVIVTDMIQEALNRCPEWNDEPIHLNDHTMDLSNFELEGPGGERFRVSIVRVG